MEGKKVEQRACKAWMEMMEAMRRMEGNGWWIGIEREWGGCRLCNRMGVVMDEREMNGEVVEFMKEWGLVDWVTGEGTKSGPGRVIVDGRTMLCLTENGRKILRTLGEVEEKGMGGEEK